MRGHLTHNKRRTTFSFREAGHYCSALYPVKKRYTVASSGSYWPLTLTIPLQIKLLQLVLRIGRKCGKIMQSQSFSSLQWQDVDAEILDKEGNERLSHQTKPSD